MKYYFYSFKLFDGSVKMSKCLYKSYEAAQAAAQKSTWFETPTCVEAMIIKGIEVFEEESE